MVSSNKKEVSKMPDKKLTDSEIIKALEYCLKNGYDKCEKCQYYGTVTCTTELLSDALDLINRLQAQLFKEQNKNSKLRNERNRLQAENEEKEEHIMELQGINKSIKSDKAFLGKEIEKYNKELLKSKVFKFVRNQNRIYNIMDFQDGEILMFYDYPEKPSALSKGYLLFKGKDDIKLANVSEVKELSYAEIKAEAYKEFAERLKDMHKHNTTSVVSLVTVFDNINNLLKEKVGDKE